MFTQYNVKNTRNNLSAEPTEPFIPIMNDEVYQALEMLGLHDTNGYYLSAVKKRWKKMALKYHPDRLESGDEEKFKKLSTAYELLTLKAENPPCNFDNSNVYEFGMEKTQKLYSSIRKFHDEYIQELSILVDIKTEPCKIALNKYKHERIANRKKNLCAEIYWAICNQVFLDYLSKQNDLFEKFIIKCVLAEKEILGVDFVNNSKYIQSCKNTEELNRQRYRCSYYKSCQDNLLSTEKYIEIVLDIEKSNKDQEQKGRERTNRLEVNYQKLKEEINIDKINFKNELEEQNYVFEKKQELREDNFIQSLADKENKFNDRVEALIETNKRRLQVFMNRSLAGNYCPAIEKPILLPININPGSLRLILRSFTTPRIKISGTDLAEKSKPHYKLPLTEYVPKKNSYQISNACSLAANLTTALQVYLPQRNNFNNDSGLGDIELQKITSLKSPATLFGKNDIEEQQHKNINERQSLKDSRNGGYGPCSIQ
jgi:hypothetical protein